MTPMSASDPIDTNRLSRCTSALILHTAELARLGQTPATSSNFSMRLDALRADWLAWNAGMPPIPQDASISLGYSYKDMPQR